MQEDEKNKLIEKLKIQNAQYKKESFEAGKKDGLRDAMGFELRDFLAFKQIEDQANGYGFDIVFAIEELLKDWDDSYIEEAESWDKYEYWSGYLEAVIEVYDEVEAEI